MRASSPRRGSRCVPSWSAPCRTPEPSDRGRGQVHVAGLVRLDAIGRHQVPRLLDRARERARRGDVGLAARAGGAGAGERDGVGFGLHEDARPSASVRSAVRVARAGMVSVASRTWSPASTFTTMPSTAAALVFSTSTASASARRPRRARLARRPVEAGEPSPAVRARSGDAPPASARARRRCRSPPSSTPRDPPPC